MSAPTSSHFSGVSVQVPSHQAVVLSKHLPKVSYVPVRAGNTNEAWQSSGTFLDFLIPPAIGVLSDVNLRFDINNTGSAQVAPSTPYWVSQIEVYVGTQQVEVLYPNDIQNETIGFKNKDELDATNEVLNANTDYVTTDQQIPAGTSTYYLPFNNCLTEARLYVNGVTEDVYYRVYFPANVFPSNIKLSSATLQVTEDVGADADRARHKHAHDKGIIYNTVVRQRMNLGFKKADATSDMTIDLTGLSGNSAGFIVYAGPAVVPGTGTSPDPFNHTGPQVPTNTLLNKRYPLKTIELNNQMGQKITEQLKGPSLIAFTWWTHVGTSYPARVGTYTYLVPFASHFRSAVEEGNNYGYLKMDNTNRLVINAPFADPTNTSESWSITITNYIYNQLVFQNGKLLNIIKK